MEHEVDWKTASKLIKPRPGCFYAVEPPFQEKVGSIYLSGEANRSLQSDIVTVIAVGVGVGLNPGDRVAIRPDHGCWFTDFEVPGYKAESRVRFYGWAWDALDNTPYSIDYDVSAPVKIGENGRMQATGHNILIQRESITTSERGILLPDIEHHRSGLAKVVSVGERVEGISPGDTIHYTNQGLLSFAFAEDERLALIREEAVNCVVLDEDAA